MKRCWRGKPMRKKKNSDEVPRTENLDETSVSILPPDKDEVVQPFSPPAHEDEEVISPNDADVSMKNLSNMVGQHIDDFIQVGRRRWDVGCFIDDRDPIYDMEGSSHTKRAKLSSSVSWSSYAYDSYSWQPK
jgi:hypothetical protein